MNNLPRHILILPDGNRRWAKKKGKHFFEGHRAGAKAIEQIVRTAFGLKIPYLTVWGLSATNVTRRPAVEVKALFRLFREFFQKLASSEHLHANKVKVNVIGQWQTLFPASTRRQVELVLEKTKNYQSHYLTLLVGYSGIEEMIEAIGKVAKNSLKKPGFKITPEVVKSNLWTKDLPPVDLVIRTGGEPHWSVGCMMWDIAETQFAFSDTFWPDFTPEEFKAVLKRYSG